MFEIEAELLPTIFYGGLLLFLLFAVGALWYRMGNVLNRLGRVEAVSEATQEKTEAVRTDMNEKFESLRSDMNEKFEAMRSDTNEKFGSLRSEMNDLKDTMVQMQLQMQRNHYQIMMAVLSHSHRADGRPVFDLPPDIEPPDAGE